MEQKLKKNNINEKISKLLNINLVKLKEILEMSENEEVYWVDNFQKMNFKKKKQNRIFVLTNLYFYNIGKGINIFSNLIGKTVKRKISIDSINSFIVSSLKNCFLFQIEEEFDYLVFYENLENILGIFIELRKKNNLKISYLNDNDLFKYAKLKNSEIKNIPNIKYDILDKDTFELIKIKSKSLVNTKKEIENYLDNELNIKEFLNFQIKSKLFINYHYYIINFGNIDYLCLILNIDNTNINKINEYININKEINNKINNNEEIFIKNEYIFKFNNLLIVLKKLNNFKCLKNKINKYKSNEKFIISLFLNLIDLIQKLPIYENYVFNLNITNIFLDSNENIKIFNFLENILLVNDDLKIKKYNSPESFKNQKEYNQNKSLIWNIGFIIYKILIDSKIYNCYKLSTFIKSKEEYNFKEVLENIKKIWNNHEIKEILKVILVPINKRISLDELVNSPLIQKLK